MSKTSKLREEENQVYFLIWSKRRTAKKSMDSILRSLLSPTGTMPSLTLLVEYVTNMVYCLELMMKLMSGNWNTHADANMHKTALGIDHPSPAFMEALTMAIRDQKYLVTPVHGIANFIPELEALYDHLESAMSRRSEEMREVNFDFSLDRRCCDFLRDHASRFHYHPYMQGDDPIKYLDQLNAETSAIKDRLQDMLDWNGDFSLRYSTFSIPWLE